MTDIALFHTATIRAGQADFENRDGQTRVHFDGKTFYYDLSGSGVTLDQFKSFVCAAWEVDDECVDISTWGADDVFRADVA